VDVVGERVLLEKRSGGVRFDASRSILLGAHNYRKVNIYPEIRLVCKGEILIENSLGQKSSLFLLFSFYDQRLFTALNSIQGKGHRLYTLLLSLTQYRTERREIL
jgi:hypothetical protein